MSDLPPLMLGLERLKAQVGTMQRGGSEADPKPHKIAMLLALLDLAEDGLLRANRIYFDDALIERFEKYFNLVRGPGDWDSPGEPYFYLRTAEFWHHKIIPGREQEYARLSTSGGGRRRIQENIEFAYLSDEAYRVISTPQSRELLQQFLIRIVNPYAYPDQKGASKAE